MTQTSQQTDARARRWRRLAMGGICLVTAGLPFGARAAEADGPATDAASITVIGHPDPEGLLPTQTEPK